MADLYYIEAGYWTPEGYYVYTADAASAVQAEFTIVCLGGLVQTVNASITATGQIVCDANKVIDVNSSLASEFTQSSTESRIRDANSSISSEFNQSTQASKTANAIISPVSLFNVGVQALVTSNRSIDCVSQFTITVDGARSRTTNITLQTIVSLSLQADKVKGSSAALLSSSSVSADARTFVISGTPYVWWGSGQPILTSLQKKWGTESLLIDGNDRVFVSGGAVTDYNIPSSNTTNEVQGLASQFTIRMWIYPTSNPTTGTRLITNASNSAQTNGWFVRQTSSPAGRIQFGIFNSGTGTTISTANSLNLNQWNYLIITRTWDSVARGTFYINLNGTIQTQALFDWNSGTSTQTLQIGATSSGFQGYVDGYEFIRGNYKSWTTEPTTEVNDTVSSQIALLNFNGTYLNQAAGQIEQASAALTAQATITVIPSGNLRLGQATLSANATVIANGNKIKQFSIALSAQCSITALLTRQNFVQGAASMSAQVTVSSSAVKIARVSQALNSTATVFASVLSLNRFQISLTSTATVACIAGQFKGATANLTSTSVIAVAIDESYLTLLYGAGNTSGYVRRIGTLNSLESSYNLIPIDVDDPRQYYKLLTPTWINFWFMIATPLTAGQTVIIYKSFSGGHRIELTRVGANYFLDFIRPYTYQDSWNPGYTNDYTRRAIGLDGVRVSLPSAPTTWTNVHGQMSPSIAHTYDPDFNNISGGGISWGNYYINGVQRTATSINGFNNDLGLGPDWSPPSLTRTTAGGDGYQWGDSTNPATLLLDQIWVKNEAHDSLRFGLGFVATSNNEYYDHEQSLNQFYQSGNRAPIASGRLVAPSPISSNNITAQAWLPWRNLLDGSSIAPTWNYQTYNGVFFGYTRDGSSNMSSAVSTTVTGQRLRFGLLNAQITALVSAQGLRQIGPITGSITATSTVNCSAVKTTVTSAQAQITATQITTATKVVQGASTQNSQFTISIAYTRIRPADSQTTITATQSTAAVKTAQAQANFTAFNSQLAVVVKTGRGLITLESQSSITANAIKTSVIGLNIISTASLSIDFLKLPQPRESSANLVSSGSISITARKTAQAQSQFASNFTQNTDATAILINTFIMNCVAAVSANAVAGKIVNASLTSTFTIAANTLNSKIMYGQCSMSALDFLFIIGTKLTLDPYYQLIVPSESRIRKIPLEIPLLTVNSENRVNITQTETMTITVNPESRIWHIPYSPQVGTRRVK